MLAYHLMDNVLTSIFFRPILGWKGFEIFESINGCLLFHWNPSLDGMPISSPLLFFIQLIAGRPHEFVLQLKRGPGL